MAGRFVWFAVNRVRYRGYVYVPMYSLKGGAHTDAVTFLSDLAPGGLTGRSAQIAAIRLALARSRLVTVTGLPGVGKTAAAVAAASGDFPDGVTLIRLDTLQDESLLAHTIATTLRLPDTRRAGAVTGLTGHLERMRTLLVLDTCEHQIGACASIASAIGEQCPGISVLATSREPLRVPGESTVMIPPLPAQDAVELLAQRVGQLTGQLTGQAIGGALARAVCERLDGLPLAIGLAARQLAAGPIEALLAALDGGYDFLADPDARVVRHRSLNAAIGWSHQLCTPAERLLWARLAVFEGPFYLKDCREVCATTYLSDETITVGVSMLAERSLLLPTDGEPTRFVMPRVIRAYGLSMLRRLAEDEDMRRRYQRWRSGPRRDQALEH
jgi:predicted ATPase